MSHELGAAGWGLLAASGLLVGALIGQYANVPSRILAYVMALGSGALISSVSFELAEESLGIGGPRQFALGLALGAVTFFGANRILDRYGAAARKRSAGTQESINGPAIAVGATFDAIPESIAIGTTLALEGSPGLAFVAAVFISNLPEGMAAATGMRRSGRPARFVLGLFGAIVVVSALSAMGGNAIAFAISAEQVAFLNAFAAGTILVMVSDTMIPEAYENGGSATGLFTALGFAVTAMLTLIP